MVITANCACSKAGYFPDKNEQFSPIGLPFVGEQTDRQHKGEEVDHISRVTEIMIVHILIA